jgi:DNA-nicking Smr family endonuclease
MRLSLLQWLNRQWRARRAAPHTATHDQFDASTAHAPQAAADEDHFEDQDSEDQNSEDQDSDELNFFPEPVRLEIGDVFDLHTIAPRDVERVVHEYLAEAARAGFRSVRIIHGKGQGVQRRLVHSILARTPFVRDWTDAPPQSGGWGATVAHLIIEED